MVTPPQPKKACLLIGSRVPKLHSIPSHISHIYKASFSSKRPSPSPTPAGVKGGEVPLAPAVISAEVMV